MSKNLFPVFDVPYVPAGEEITRRKYKTAPLFDTEKGEFVLNGAKQMMNGTGYEAWVLWCTKTIMTQRWAHCAYSGNSGIEAAEAFKKPDRKAIESAFERTITEALLADPMGRTRQVQDFSFHWRDGGLELSCLVFGTDGDTATIKGRHLNNHYNLL